MLARPVATSYWPFSIFLSSSSPFWAASVRKRENLLKPMAFSSKVESMSSITCLRRSDRMTSRRFAICSTAFCTSVHGSCWLNVSPVPAFLRPERVV